MAQHDKIDYARDKRIDAYISGLAEWQQPIAQRVRELAHAADPEVVETIKRTDRPYFVLAGNICALLGAKNHLNIFIYDPTVPDPEHIINQGQGNQTARAIQIYGHGQLNEQALLRMLEVIIANNRAGGWRRLSKQ